MAAWGHPEKSTRISRARKRAKAPLRELDGDPELLLSLFLEKKCRQRGIVTPAIPAKTLAQLRQYTWPGNVRELENLAEKYATLHTLPQFDVPLMAGVSDFLANTDDEDGDDSASLEEFISAKVSAVFRSEDGNITKTAQRFAIDRNTVKRWLEKVSSNGTAPAARISRL